MTPRRGRDRANFSLFPKVRYRTLRTSFRGRIEADPGDPDTASRYLYDRREEGGTMGYKNN
jgi:hypothetical protein